MTTLTRIDPAAVLALARSDLPRPLDVLNLIELRDERSYARYGIAVAPAMRAVGARLRWMGHRVRTLSGEPGAERLLVVRYPSHRRFLAMTVNPYYMLINRFRERGVERFQAAFTFADHEPLPLRSQRRLLVARFADAARLADVRALIEPQAGPLVYASRMVASADFLRGSRPTDPNPLTLPATACFAVPDGEAVEFDGGALDDDVSVALYRRTDPRTLLEVAR